MKEWLLPIRKLGACSEALEWADNYDSLEDVWVKCKRGDWMLWLLGRLSGTPDSDRSKKLVYTTLQCARLSLPYVENGEVRPLKAIETAEAWASEALHRSSKLAHAMNSSGSSFSVKGIKL